MVGTTEAGFSLGGGPGGFGTPQVAPGLAFPMISPGRGIPTYTSFPNVGILASPNQDHMAMQGALFQIYWTQNIDVVLRQVGADLRALIEELYSMVTDEMLYAVDYMKMKYSLPGAPVSQGGRPGPAPGAPGQRVLHVDPFQEHTSLLVNAPYARLNGKLLTSEARRIAVRWGGKRELIEDFRLQGELGIRPDSESFIYASNHEYGHYRVPARPVVRPAIRQAMNRVSVRSAEIMANWNTAGNAWAGGGMQGPMGQPDSGFATPGYQVLAAAKIGSGFFGGM